MQKSHWPRAMLHSGTGYLYYALEALKGLTITHEQTLPQQHGGNQTPLLVCRIFWRVLKRGRKINNIFKQIVKTMPSVAFWLGTAALQMEHLSLRSARSLPNCCCRRRTANTSLGESCSRAWTGGTRPHGCQPETSSLHSEHFLKTSMQTAFRNFIKL